MLYVGLLLNLYIRQPLHVYCAPYQLLAQEEHDIRAGTSSRLDIG